MLDTNDEQLRMLAAGSQPAIVKFWSPKCGACNLLAPAFAELAQQCTGQIWFLNAQVEQLPESAASLQIDKLPTLILFQNGKEKDRLIGVPRFQKLIEFVSQALI